MIATTVQGNNDNVCTAFIRDHFVCYESKKFPFIPSHKYYFKLIHKNLTAKSNYFQMS